MSHNFTLFLPETSMGCLPQSISGQRTCLLILGMHRSGTSAITRICNLMGAELPKQLVAAGPSNEAGHWEPERLVFLHDQMLAEVGSSWRDLRTLDLTRLNEDRVAYYKSAIRSIIQDEFGDANVFVLKDPRICRFIPFYRILLNELGIRIYPIIVIRNPLDVSASLSARNNMSGMHGLLLWLRHCLDAEKYTRDMSRILVSYDRVIHDTANLIARLRSSFDHCFAFPSSPSDTDRLSLESIRPDLRHHASSLTELDHNSITNTWIKEAYHALQGLLTANDKSAMVRLDRISREFNNYAPLLGQLADDIDALRIKEQELEDKSHFLLETIKQLREQIQNNAEQHLRALQQNAEQHACELQRIAEQHAREIQQNAEQRAREVQQGAERQAREIQQNAERHAREIQQNAEQHAREIQQNAEQHARETQQNTEQYARILAGLQRVDYEKRLPPELTGLRQWLSNRSKRRRRFVQDYHKIAASPLFDKKWYLQKNPDVAAGKVNAALHYLRSGGREGRAPGPYFQANAYLKANPDVTAAGANPLLHFLGRYKDGEE
jgi:hypothetical protein